MGYRLFRFCSWLFIATYGRFPLFGELRSSIGVIQRGDQFLLQHRSDGLGWAFPGGVSWFWENEEQTLKREIREETGMEVVSPQKLFVYRDRRYIPSRVTVFSAEVTGELRGSWEGEARWLPLAVVCADFFPAQQAILEQFHARPDGESRPLGT